MAEAPTAGPAVEAPVLRLLASRHPAQRLSPLAVSLCGSRRLPFRRLPFRSLPFRSLPFSYRSLLFIAESSDPTLLSISASVNGFAITGRPVRRMKREALALCRSPVMNTTREA